MISDPASLPEDHHQSQPVETQMVIFMSIVLGLGGILKTLKANYKFPYSPTLLVAGFGTFFLFSKVLEWHDLEKSFRHFLNTDPHGLLSIFVPILLFTEYTAQSIFSLCEICVGANVLTTSDNDTPQPLEVITQPHP